MNGRKERYLKKKRMKTIKRLIGTVFLIGLLCSSFSVAFAEQDIQSLMANWFDNRKNEAMSEISQAINHEKNLQTNRLKEELQSEIERAEEALNQFTLNEINARRERLRQYTDELIANLNISNEEEEKKIVEELERIYIEAKEKMESVSLKGSPVTPTPSEGADEKEEGTVEEEGQAGPTEPVIPPVESETPVNPIETPESEEGSEPE